MTVLKDALANLRDELGTGEDYCKGLVVGVVATIMELKKLEFHAAVEFMFKNQYIGDFDSDKLPDAWRETFIAMSRKYVNVARDRYID